MRVQVRRAHPSEGPAIEAMLAPEIEQGTVLPRDVDPLEFFVAVGADGGLVGVVGMQQWSPGVVELGSLVSTVRGRGVGQMLVDAVLAEAARLGLSSVVALTGLEEWFQRRGFSVHGVAPWQLARREPVLLTHASPSIDAAVAHKSARSCAHCPLLAQCQQRLMVRTVALPVRRVA